MLNSNVCVSESRRGAKKTANGEEEGGVSIEGQGGMGWKESGSIRKEVGGGGNWASVHTSPPPIRVTHLPSSQHVTLHF